MKRTWSSRAATWWECWGASPARSRQAEPARSFTCRGERGTVAARAVKTARCSRKARKWWSPDTRRALLMCAHGKRWRKRISTPAMRRQIERTNMKRCTILVLICVVTPWMFAQDKALKAGQTAAESWLTLVDNADYAGSYDQAASVFKSAVTKADWQQKITAARGPLGKMLSRKVKFAQYTTSLPGAPDG